MIFETDLDYSRIEKMSHSELLSYIKENFVSPNVVYPDDMSFEKCANIMSVLCTRLLKIQPSPEQWIFLLADCERLLCEACAGAGKTTMAQLRSVKEKLCHNISGNNILALAYNNHAVEDMKSRHNYIIHKVNSLKLPQLRRDSNISCYTFHGFCKSWVEDYLSEFGIVNKTNYLMSDTDRHSAMQMAVNTFKEQYNSNIFVNDAIIESLLSLYSFVHETLRMDRQDEWKLCPSMSDLTAFKPEQITDLFQRYEKWKKLKKKMDFTDLVDSMYTLCKRQDVMDRIRANYRIYILDEYQDLTPSMLRVIKIILEGDPALGMKPYREAKLTCIGDGDQSIYGFRGTDPDNCIRFKDTYSSDDQLVRVTAMSENRRCPSQILDYARAVIESNSRRIVKPIRAISDDGKVTVNKYYSVTEEMSSLIHKLRLIPEDKLSQTCICYRNQSSSYMLGLCLAEQGIPFRIARGNFPLTDKLSQSLFDVLNMLSYPTIPLYVGKALYKVVPKSGVFTSATINEIIKREEEIGKATGETRDFFHYEYPSTATGINGFQDALSILAHAGQMHKFNKPMSDYVPALVQLIRKYYLDWQLLKSNTMSKEYIEYITAWFSRDITYDDFMKQYNKLIADAQSNSFNKVCLTTFHGLKGLEFENVFIVDMSDTIFPGTELNQVKDLSNAQKDILECEARRLFYVALTRSKKNLEIFFNAEVPSRYIRFFTQNTGLADTYKEYIPDDTGFLLSSDDTSLESDDLEQLEELEELDEELVESLDELPQAALINEELQTERDAMQAALPSFTKFFKEAEKREEKLVREYGEKNIQSLQGKSTILNILDRITAEKNS